MMMTLVMMVASIFASSQVIIRNNPVGSDANKAGKLMFSQPTLDMTQYDVFQNPYSTVYMPKQSKQAEENQQMVNVTCQFVYDENVYRPGFGVYIYDENNRYSIDMDWQTGQFIGSVPPGTYDIFSTFFSIEPEKTGLELFHIKEQVEITGDTVIEIRADEITNKVECVARNENGERFEHDLVYLDENNQWVVAEDGNIDVTIISFNFFGNGQKFLCDCNIFGGLQDDKTGSYCDLFINDVSERYSIVIAKTNIDLTNHTFYVNKFYPESVHVGKIDNNPADYIHSTEGYKVSILGKNTDTRGINVYPEYTYKSHHNGEMTDGAYACEGEDQIDLDVYLNNPYGEDEGNVLARFWYVDNLHMLINTYNSYVFHEDGTFDIVEVTDTSYQIPMIVAQPMVIKDGEIYYYCKGQIEHALLGSRQPFQPFGVVNEKRDYNAIAHPAFSFYKRQKGLDWGTTVPVGSFCDETHYDQWRGGNYLGLSCDYYGQLGELRMNDLDALTMSLKYNGEEVCNDYFKLDSLAQAMIEQQVPAGVIDATFVNANVEIDDMTGCNTMEVHFDQTQEDAIAPTMRMLQLRSTEDMVTNRFAQADEGLLQFACGDFDYHYNNERYFGWFDCDEAPTVEVSYAPYGEDNWNELEVEEIPELFFLPGFGNFFRGSLSSVTGEALNGWFDLKIRLTDAAGNWQEQVISPAFRIDDLAYSNVATIGSDNAHEVARYSLDGKRVDMNHRGVTIVKMSDGTARKVIQ